MFSFLQFCMNRAYLSKGQAVGLSLSVPFMSSGKFKDDYHYLLITRLSASEILTLIQK